MREVIDDQIGPAQALKYLYGKDFLHAIGEFEMAGDLAGAQRAAHSLARLYDDDLGRPERAYAIYRLSLRYYEHLRAQQHKPQKGQTETGAHGDVAQ